VSARYDVWTDPDLLDLVRDDPALVAIADALRETEVAEAARSRKRRVRRVSLLAAALVLGLSLAVAAPWDRSGSSAFAGRALAAVGRQPVLHVVVEVPTGGKAIDVTTGASTPVTGETEIWYDGARGLERTILRSGGAVFLDQLETPDGWFTSGGSGRAARPAPALEPALRAFVEGYQQALADGKATETGKGFLDGRPVVWLSFPLQSGQSEQVAIDTQTNRPLLLRMSSDSGGPYAIKSIETIPYDAADFRRPAESEQARHDSSGATIDVEDVSVTPSSLPDLVPGAVWAGPTLAGLPLAITYRETLRTSYGDGAKREARGIRLFYGSLSSDGSPDYQQPYVQVSESSDPQAADLGPFGLRSPVVSQAPGKLYGGPSPLGGAVGSMRVNGVYATIRASNEAFMLAAARALKPAG
jgi:hypothetical protein